MKNFNVCSVWGLIAGLVLGGSSLCAEVRYELHRGPISELHRKELLPLRSTLFSGYPYLYCSNPDRETHVWDTLSRPSTILVLAYDNDQLVGTVISLAVDDTSHTIVQQHSGFKPRRCLMIDMVMVLESYQRKGVARELLRLFQAEALSQGYTDVYGITVVRSVNHPLKPQHFIDVDEVWSRMGGTQTGLYEVWNWPTWCGTPDNKFVAPIDNMVQYWHKRITPSPVVQG